MIHVAIFLLHTILNSFEWHRNVEVIVSNSKGVCVSSNQSVATTTAIDVLKLRVGHIFARRFERKCMKASVPENANAWTNELKTHTKKKK